MNAREIDSAVERSRQYHNVDGLGEFGTGLMCLGFALLGWMQLHTPPGSLWNQMYGCFLYLAALMAVIHYGTKAIKNRITYRRTGYAGYGSIRKQRLPAVIAAGVSAVVAAGLVLAIRRKWDLSLAVPLFGLFLSAAYIRIAKTARWKWWIFSAMVAGMLAVAALPANLTAAVAQGPGLKSGMPAGVLGAYWLTFIVYGGLLAISGAISFRLYLSHTQPAGGQL
ncbi:MAG: hypothetical protein ACM336_17670 [Acidobacteriota bacterium]